MTIYFPTWFLFVDYVLGFLMWLFILKFNLTLFFSENTKLNLISYIYKVVRKLLELMYKVTPSFLPEPIVPLYFGWIFFMIRFYILPIFSGFEEIGYLAFSIENHIYQYFESYILNRI